MENEYSIILFRFTISMLVGGLIGLERAFHGRPAGFRTHTLVCTSSTLLILLTVNQLKLIGELPLDPIRIDPMRMAQGIMTGIGFLGAGAIVKEKLNIRGLTTAASIWMTASIGISIGMGLYFIALIGSIITFVILSLFRLIENRMPSFHFGRFTIRFIREQSLSQQELITLMNSYDITTNGISYYMEDNGKYFKYQMNLRTNQKKNFEKLVTNLLKTKNMYEFSIIPLNE